MKIGAGLATPLEAGVSILAAARTVDTRPIETRLGEFERAQNQLNTSHGKVQTAEAQLAGAQLKLGHGLHWGPAARRVSLRDPQWGPEARRVPLRSQFQSKGPRVYPMRLFHECERCRPKRWCKLEARTTIYALAWSDSGAGQGQASGR